MPDNNKTPVRSFKIDGQVFDIPESKVNDFLNDAPEAEEIRSYTVGKDTFDIPVPQVEEFLTDAPEAKPVQQYPEQQENTADYGPFDKETVEKYPQARQNFKRWQKGQTTARQDSVEPTIDPNAVNFKDENFKKPTPETKDDDLTGFWQEIGKRGHRSAIELNKMLANAPDFVNRIAVQAFNASPPGQAIQGIGEIVGQNWKMEAKDLRPEQFNEYSEKQKEQLTKKIAEINPKHEQGIIESAKKGDWITFTRNLAGGVADSFAPSLAMMISGAGMAAPGMISSGAAVFGAGKYDEMDKAAPNMTEDAKVMAAAANGAFEGIFETYLGSGAVGKAFRKIIEQEGKQAAKGVVQRGLSKGFSDLLSKYPALAPLGEGFEEMGTQVAQNVVDKYSGYRPDISITEGVADAGAIGMAAGASHSAPLYATKKVVDGIAGTPQQPTGPNQPQAPVDPEGQAPTVNPEQQLNALREQYRQEAAGKLDEFKHKTGNIVTGVDHKGNTYFVKDGDRADEDGMLIVYDENGKKEQIHENNISDWVTTDYESALEAQMQAFDQQVEQRLRPQVNDKVNYQGQPHIILEDNGDSYTLADMQGNPVDNVPKQTIIQENQAQQPAEATEGQQPGVQPQEQPQPKPVVTETIGGNKYGFTENEDGSLDLVIPENAEPQKLLTQLEKEFKDNPDWEVRAEKEVVEVPPESRFQRPTQREIIRNIQVAPKNNQNVTGQTSQENKTSEINPELKQQVEAETQPSYQYRGQEIDRETAQGLIEVAAMQENPEKLNDLVVNNDEQLTKLMQKSFPEKKPSYKLGNRNLTPAQVKAAILAAETPEELSRVKIQNDNQFDELLQQKEEEFNQAAQKEQEQRNREHDYLVSKLRTHNNLSEGIRQRANTSQIVQKAAQLGYTVKPGNKGKLIVTNKNGSEIQYTPDRTSSQKKNQHPTLQEYDNDFQQKVETILSPAALTVVELGDLRPAEVKQGVIDIQAGKKTVPANRLLDELENAYNSGVVEWKGDRTTGERGPQMSFDEFVNFWQGSELNEQEQAAAEQIPEETADAILDDEGELTPEMWNELYNQYVNLEQNEQETGSVQETETPETTDGEQAEETGTESTEIVENDSKQEEKLTETESQQPEQQTSEEISEDRSLQNREEISETGEERLQNWWEEYDVVNEITDFSGQKQQGEWIKIANAYFPLSEVQKYNSKDELLAAKLKEGETQQQSTDVQENLTTEQEGVKEPELTPEETEIYNQAKTVVDNSLKNTTPEEMQKAKTGSGFAAAKFAMRYTSPEKNQRLYNAIYNLYFDAVKNYPTEQVSGNLTNETTKAEQPENRGKEATKKTFKLPIEKNLEQAEERVEKKNKPNLEAVPPDDWRNNLMKARTYARDLMGVDELTKRRNENTLDWTDKDSIVKAIDEYSSQKQPENKTNEDVSQEKEQKAEYGANNKVVSKERYEELRKKMRDKLNNLNAGFDPEIFTMGAEMAAFHVEAGARKFADFAKLMTDDFGDAIKPYLKAIYKGAGDMPGMEQVKKEMDSPDVVDNYNLDDIGKVEQQQEVAEQKEEQPDPDENELRTESISPKAFVVTGNTRPIKDKLKGLGGKWLKKYSGWMFPKTRQTEVEREFGIGWEKRTDETGMTPVDKLVISIQKKLAAKEKIKNTPQLTALAEQAGMKLGEEYSDIKELYDLASVALNEYFAENNERYSPEGKTPAQAKEIVQELIEMQDLLPTETQRSARQVELQQFSTPPAFAFLANWTAGINENDHALEPSAGEGNIATFAKAAGATVYVNEIDQNRSDNLRKLGFDRIVNEDAKHLHAVKAMKDVPVTVVVMNPPFSKDIALGGKMDLHAAEKHIDAALSKLEDEGRLVAIVGKGMSFDSHTHKPWWDKIKKKYQVRANVLVNGNAYSKKGTNFDNRLLVIDKNGETFPSDNIVQGNALNYSELVDILQQIPKRPRITYSKYNDYGKSEQSNQKQNVRPSSGSQREGTTSSTTNVGGVQPGSTGQSQSDNIRPSGNGGRNNQSPSLFDQQRNEDAGTGRTGSTGQTGQTNRTGQRRGTTQGNTDNKSSVRGNEQQPSSLPEQASPENKSGRTKPGERLSVKRLPKQNTSTEIVGYDEYAPEIAIEGSKPHPTKLVESSAMGSVSLPETDYVPQLDKKIIESGALSNAQLEDVILAGNAHRQTLPNGETRGFFLGAGTGYGKGRTIAAVIMDNWNRGNKKAVWVSKNDKAHRESSEYWEAVGGDPKKAFMAKNAKKPINQKNGVLLTKYGTISGNYEVNDPYRQSEAFWTDAPQTRLQQLAQWLGRDFDGVIAFDESHEMANATGGVSARGRKDPAKKALAGIELQEMFPNAKIIYSSATGATEVSNLAYAQRLGLWGDGTPFSDPMDFISAVENSGVAGMEIVAKDLKAMGLYTAKSISYEGVEYNTLNHDLMPEQKELYNKVGRAWRTIYENVEAAIDANNTSSRGKAFAKGRFWSTQQRFFNQIITTLQMPSVIQDVQKQLDEGRAPIIQLVNTNEAQQERSLAEAKQNKKEEIDYDELDMSPKQMLLDFLRNGFPVGLYEDRVDENGNTQKVPVRDSEGNQVTNPEAERIRDNLIAELDRELTLPESPLDMILNTFGAENVAEITGRSNRIVQRLNDNNELVKVEERRTDKHTKADTEAFMNGKKNVLVFSQAGGTGASFHASLEKKNQKQRVHYVLQAGWRADSAIQGFGRSHRSNQRIAPIFKLVTTDLKSQKRFLSSIAKRLEQLGALTKGQRDTGGQGILDGSYNLEGKYAKQALFQFYSDVNEGRVNGVDISVLEDQMALEIFKEVDGVREYNKDVVFNTKQFLNRIMSLDIDLMDKVFDGYMERLDEQVKIAKDSGTYDSGIESVEAENIKVVDQQPIHTDERTKAKTYITSFEVSRKNNKRTWEEINDEVIKYGDKFKGFYKQNNSGNVFGIVQQRVMNSDGSMETKIKRMSVSADSHITNYDLQTKYEKIDNAEAKEEWDDSYEKAPDVHKRTESIIKGLILPIWNRLPEKINVRRYIDEKGEIHLGRFFNNRDIQKISDQFEVENSQQYPTEQVKQIVKDGGVVRLSNGFEFTKARYQGVNVMKINNVSPYRDRERLERAGAIFNVKSSMAMTGDFYISMDRATNVIEQIKELFGVNVIAAENEDGEFVPARKETGNNVRYRTTEPLYSPTERALERIKQEKGTPEQFKSMLLKNGAKQAELDLMGFDEFSQDKKSLTKQEIQEWIDGNKVEIEEVEKGEGQTTTNDAVMNLPEDGKLNVMYLPVTDKLKKVATEQGMPLFKDTESQFITDRIHNNKLKALFQKYFENAKNTGTIHVVTSPQEVPVEFRQKQTLKGTQGFYDVNTGETYFITGNIQDPAEAFKTWVHEVGVHRGLSNIIPPAELNSFFQKIYDDIGSEEIKANIPESYHELDPTEQAEEYLAFLGEKVVNEKDLTPREKGVWQRIIDTVKNILNKLFTGARYTTKDAENVVKAAVQSVYQPPTGPKGSSANQTRDIRYRKTSDKLEDAQSAILNSDGFINDNIEALRAATEAYNEQAPGKVPLKKSLEQMREFWIDQNMPIRRWEEEIKKRGGKQDDNSKPYRDIRNMFGRMEALYRKFQDQKMNPIKDSIVKLVDSGIDSKSILPYIIAKHGLERNRVMRQNRLDEWKLNYEAKNGEKPSQEMTEAQAAKLEGQDFSGLKPFDTNDKFDNVDDLARSIVDGFEQQAEDKLLNEFWDNIRSATSYTLETWKEGGQISEKEYEKLKKQYKHFVPLRGWREDAAKFLNYKDNEGGIGKSLKRALGRKSLADNPFAYIQSVAFKAINEQVTNEIKQSAFRLVFNNYGGDFKDLHQIKRAYLVRKEIWNEETEQNEEAWVLYRDENGNLARPPKEMFDEGDVKIEFNNDHEKLRTIWNAKQHEVVVRNNGGFSVMIFPDSQLSVAQSLNNQNTMANFLGHSFDARKLGETWLFRGLGSVTNFMKGMMTSYNPVFPATNFFRDQPEAALTQFIRGNARVADFPTKYTPIAAKAIIENIAGKNKNGKYVEELRNFYEAGGTTGFTHEKRVEQLEKELKKEIDRALRASTTKGKTIDKLTHILDYIEHWNRIFEDTTRFAVYLSARDKGMTVRDAAFQSRTASVDFNMKGKGTRVVESFFAFFKAGINALQKNAKLGKDHPKRFAATAAGVATLGLLEALVNDWIDDDDEYYRLNDYVRQNYFVLQKWWGDENEYLRIPLPQFWRGFHALGVSVYDYAKGKSTLGEAIGQTVSNMIAGMAPIDVTGFIHEGKFSSDPLWPTSIKPIREIVVNRNFMGSQIAMEPFTKSLEEDLSDSGLHKRNVNPLIKFVTDMMFKAAGGEGKLKFKMTEDGELKYVVDALDVNPSKIEHFINGYLGGTSKFLNDFVTTLWQFGDTEEEFDINNAPFLNSFIRNVPEEKWGILREYQAFEDAIQDADKYRSTAQSDMNAEGMKKFYRSDYAEAKAVYDIYDSAISDIMEAYGFDSEEAAKEVTDLMKEAIDKFEQLNIKEK